MSNITKLEEKIAKLKVKAGFDSLLPKGSSWLSKKLLSMLAIVAGLIWLGRDNLTLVIYGMIILGSVYMLTQTLHDIFVAREDGQTRRKLIDAMSADGLNDDERKALGISTEKQING